MGSPSHENTVAVLRRRIDRLAFDIHDGPLQNLAVIGLDLNELRERVRSLLPADHVPQVEAAVDHVLGDLLDVERSLRELLCSLERERAACRALVEGLQAEIAEFERHSGVRVNLVVAGTPDLLTEPECAAVHAIARAALANVSKHADARTVTVRVGDDGGRFVLEVEDDGRGFNLLDACRPGHFGLRGMRERAEEVGGRAEIRSRPGGPTVVSATLRRTVTRAQDEDLLAEAS